MTPHRQRLTITALAVVSLASASALTPEHPATAASSCTFCETSETYLDLKLENVSITNYQMTP